MDGLKLIYTQVGQVNKDLAGRMLGAAKNDVNVLFPHFSSRFCTESMTVCALTFISSQRCKKNKQAG